MPAGPPARPAHADVYEARWFVPGARVRLTGAFLKRSGQQRGGEGSKVWTLVACPCALCEHCGLVAVDERSASDPERQRHIARRNLMVEGAPPRASDFP